MFRDPFRIALLLLSCLSGSSEDPELQDALRPLVTPESRPGFGDFRDARERLASIDQWAVGDQAAPAFRDPDVAYIKVPPEWRPASASSPNSWSWSPR